MSTINKNRIKGFSGLFILLFFAWISWVLLQNNITLGIFLLVGLGLGYVETHSEVGIASGFVDFFVTGSRTRLYGLLLLFGFGSFVALIIHAWSSTNGAVPQYLADANQTVIPGTGAVTPINFGLIFGGFLFGVGLTLNEGCGLGTLRNMGRGQTRFLLTFLFILIGTVPGQWVKYWLDQSFIHAYSINVYFPEVFGYSGTMMLSIFLFGLFVFSAIRYEKRRQKEGTFRKVKDANVPNISTENSEHPIALYIVKENWSRFVSVLFITFFLVFALLFTGEKLAVTRPYIYPAVALFQSLGVTFSSPAFSEPMEVVNEGLLNNHYVLQNIGILFGASIFSLTSTEFTFSWAGRAKEIGWYSLSGGLMGFGAILASGCIIGALYSGIVNFSLSGWVVFASMSLGIWLTVKVMNGKISTIPKITN